MPIAMLDTFHLRTFVTVVEAGSYSAAAEQLHMSQPAVSQHIHALEEQLDGVRLFRRIGKRMAPTHAGEELLLIARELLALSERAEASIKALKGHIGGHVVLGCSSGSAELLLPQLLAIFHARFPAVSIQVQVAPTRLLLERLAQQQLHLLFIEEFQRRRGWEARSIAKEELVLLGHYEHPALDQLPLSLDSFVEQALILPPLGAPLRRQVDDWLRRRGFNPAQLNVVLETESVSLSIEAVRARIGLAFIPQSCLPKDEIFEQIPLSNVSFQHEWHIVRTRDEHAPQSLTELYAFMTGGDAQQLLEEAGLQPVAQKEESVR
jgi:DNA-binding transcriptional LysR family regulator